VSLDATQRPLCFLCSSFHRLTTALALAVTQAINIDANPQYGEQPHLNGDALGAPSPDDIENKVILDIVDDLVHSTEVSISGGSDNEASKSDVSKLKDGERGHGRTSSAVKKLASFKAISVNKTFLTSKGAGSTTPVKPAEKAAFSTGTTPAPSGTLTTSRPRLVAKSGSGIVAKTSGANGGKPGAAPDPNAVWNKNRRMFGRLRLVIIC